MNHSDSMYSSLASLLSYLLTCGVVVAVTVVTIQYGIAPTLDRLFAEVATNLTRAM